MGENGELIERANYLTRQVIVLHLIGLNFDFEILLPHATNRTSRPSYELERLICLKITSKAKLAEDQLHAD